MTVGKHIRKARQELGLLQRELAELIGVCEETILHWEWGQTEPTVHDLPAVIRFLGFDPSPAPHSGLGVRMLAYRRQRGLSIKEPARLAGVDAAPGRLGASGLYPDEARA